MPTETSSPFFLLLELPPRHHGHWDSHLIYISAPISDYYYQPNYLGSCLASSPSDVRSRGDNPLTHHNDPTSSRIRTIVKIHKQNPTFRCIRAMLWNIWHMYSVGSYSHLPGVYKNTLPKEIRSNRWFSMNIDNVLTTKMERWHMTDTVDR